MTVTVGTRAPRSDGEAKVRGDAVFGVDFSLPGMLYARLIRSPVPAGRLLSIDTAAASAMDGVHVVVTGAEAPNDRSGIVLFDMPLFASDYIAYEGEPLAAVVAESKNPPFEFAVVDEAQDISVAQLRFLAALGADRPNSLFFAGDLGQRIFQQPFSWLALGIDIRGRARTLRVNYRTSHQIRMQADRLLGPEVADVDGNVEERAGTVSVFNGSVPTIVVCDTLESEEETVSKWMAALSAEGVAPHEFGVFVRSPAELDRARAAVKSAGLPYVVLDEKVETTSGQLAVGTMHLAKGLEFRAVVVMACDDEIIPLQERIETVADESDLEDVYNTERHLLYVACTRARDHLLVTSVAPASEFLDDLQI